MDYGFIWRMEDLNLGFSWWQRRRRNTNDNSYVRYHADITISRHYLDAKGFISHVGGNKTDLWCSTYVFLSARNFVDNNLADVFAGGANPILLSWQILVVDVRCIVSSILCLSTRLSWSAGFAELDDFRALNPGSSNSFPSDAGFAEPKRWFHLISHKKSSTKAAA